MAWAVITSRSVTSIDGLFKLNCKIYGSTVSAYLYDEENYYTHGELTTTFSSGTTYRARYVSTVTSGIKTSGVVSTTNLTRPIPSGTIYIEYEYTPSPPPTPSSITVPATVNGGESINISWGSSSGATRYYLERSINSGAFTAIYNSTTLNYTDTITKGWNTVSYRVRAYNNDGYSGYTTSATRTVINNSPPTISGVDTNLGDKNSGFTISYSVNDADAADNLTVKEKINGVTIKTLNNAPRNQEFTIEITEEMLYSYDLHTTNTIEIEVNDGQGNVVYRRYTFKRTNTAPKISGADSDLGEKTEGFDITFSATDQENDSMSAKVYLNDKLVKAYEFIEPNQEYIYSLGRLDFVQLNNTDVHKIRIEVQDHNNATAIRNYTFTRKLNRILYAFEKETDIMATQILISPTWYIAAGAEAKVLVCNNAYDEEPTWEDATEQVLLERHFNFINTVKTGATWVIGVQIIINKGTATELSYLAGFGGAYK